MSEADNAQELQAMHDAGATAFREGRPRQCPVRLLLSEGKAWYRGFDAAWNASMDAWHERQMAKPFEERNFE